MEKIYDRSHRIVALPERKGKLPWIMEDLRRSREMKLRRILAAFVTLVCLCGCRSAKNKTIPDELVGVWKSSAPKYADRFFELRKDEILIGTGGSNVSVNPIVKVEELREENAVLYVIHYIGEGGSDYVLSFYYDATNGGTIRFKNQMQFEWRKAG